MPVRTKWTRSHRSGAGSCIGVGAAEGWQLTPRASISRHPLVAAWWWPSRGGPTGSCQLDVALLALFSHRRVRNATAPPMAQCKKAPTARSAARTIPTYAAYATHPSERVPTCGHVNNYRVQLQSYTYEAARCRSRGTVRRLMAVGGRFDGCRVHSRFATGGACTPARLPSGALGSPRATLRVPADMVLLTS